MQGIAPLCSHALRQSVLNARDFVLQPYPLLDPRRPHALAGRAVTRHYAHFRAANAKSSAQSPGNKPSVSL